ncbi:MAG: hypothetical protein L3V56_13390 [Candidatus Magnetoovum sp. WYHC-5]|nr:hypothetical protein [Candidatus Magnetoovum sp. WYHC-5]
MIEPIYYLMFAEEMLNTNKSDELEEVRLRTAINRAYYGVYHYVQRGYCDFMSLNEIEIISHSAFIKKLRDDRNSAIQRLGNQLYALKNDRVKADYHINANIEKTIAHKSYALAQKIKKTADFIFYNVS